jgi:uncharacterized membrane protein (UPF0127 family)
MALFFHSRSSQQIPHKAITRVLVIILLLWIGVHANAQQRTGVITVRFFQITVEIADTPASRTQGLMGRRALPINHGMLFVFERPERQCFWMKNTLIPLSVAFVADDGTLVNLDEMKAQTLNAHCSEKPVRYVLEMNTGWFAKKGLKAGNRLQGQPFDSAQP